MKTFITFAKQPIEKYLMKKILLFIVFGLFLALLINTGCKKDLITNLLVSVSSDSCKIGDMVTIQWRSENASSMMLDRETIPLSGSKTVTITSDTTFTFIAYPEVDLPPVIKTVTIHAKELTIEDYMSDFGPWRMALIKMAYTDDEGIRTSRWYTSYDINTALDCQKDDKMWFTRNPNLSSLDMGTLCEGETDPGVSVKWILKGSTLHFGSGDGTGAGYKIVIANRDSLVYTYPSVETDGSSHTVPVIVEETFIH
jgi:hypothetical protein